MKKTKLGHIGIVSEKGWVVIPSEMRERYGWAKGSQVVIIDDGEGVYIATVSEDPIRQAMEMFKDGPSLTEALLEDRRLEREREEAKEKAWRSKNPTNATKTSTRGRVRS